MDREIFKKVIIEIVKDKDYDSKKPRTFFIRALLQYNKIAGREKINMNRSLFGDYRTEERIFTSILNELGVEIEPGVLARLLLVTSSSFVTPVMKKGAGKADFRHRRTLGNDY